MQHTFQDKIIARMTAREAHKQMLQAKYKARYLEQEQYNCSGERYEELQSEINSLRALYYEAREMLFSMGIDKSKLVRYEESLSDARIYGHKNRVLPMRSMADLHPHCTMYARYFKRANTRLLAFFKNTDKFNLWREGHVDSLRDEWKHRDEFGAKYYSWLLKAAVTERELEAVERASTEWCAHMPDDWGIQCQKLYAEWIAAYAWKKGSARDEKRAELEKRARSLRITYSQLESALRRGY